ncbi:NAD(P)-dependent dehydrogenase (short-subunit alcohol dehydrogenase family) [Paenibacillus sp. RC254]|uniref:SDR family NAD(P)-dependent oxidoreductase n=1 Tax=unclassified Paenibacillus TaxID=185978 RepID=UPI0024BB5388|nr:MULTISPECIES: SDR family NAD(P)-dependent oxidoreductase [unclassified Paenibacillus]
MKADSSKFEDIRAAITETINAFGNINILVNNAAVSIRKPYEQIAPDEFDHVISVNVRSIFLSVQTVAPQMGHGGRIINIGSLNSQNNPFPTILFM